MIHKTAERNHEIFESHRSGVALADLARQFGLSQVTVKQIILREKHKQAVGAEPFYRSSGEAQSRTKSVKLSGA